ncbi:hypothetical protein HK405_010245, partial [Cladochytrium tenue]
MPVAQCEPRLQDVPDYVDQAFVVLDDVSIGLCTKDPGQARILAIRIRREGFIRLLGSGRLSNHGRNNGEATQGNGVGHVVVQWDLERGPRLERLSNPGADVRSIQIGIGPALVGRWIEEWIVDIEDVTERAHALESAVRERPDVSAGQLCDMGLIPDEREFGSKRGWEWHTFAKSGSWSTLGVGGGGGGSDASNGGGDSDVSVRGGIEGVAAAAGGTEEDDGELVHTASAVMAAVFDRVGHHLARICPLSSWVLFLCHDLPTLLHRHVLLVRGQGEAEGGSGFDRPQSRDLGPEASERAAHLAGVARAFVARFVPAEELRSGIARFAACEVLSLRILDPAMEKICSPQLLRHLLIQVKIGL